MPLCTFFGHRDSPDSLQPKLLAAIEDLIVHHQVDQFYVGHQGAFDRMAAACLMHLSARYPHIRCAVVLAYLPQGKPSPDRVFPLPTLVPEGLETIPPRFAILRRNQWMLSRTDYVIGYLQYPFGGAAPFIEKADRLHKTVIRL